METSFEVDRLERVYREYATRGFGQSKWSPGNKGNLAIQEECLRKIREKLQKTGFLPLDKRRILDVGCGTGERLAALADLGARAENLFGVDLIRDRINEARQKHPGITFQCGNAENLPFADHTFDLVTVFTVLSSILSCQMASHVCLEINRVLRSGGAVIWYDFRVHNPWNRHVRGMSRRQIQKLFPDFKPHLESVSLLPPLARRLGRLTNLAYSPLCSIPFLRSHYLGVLTKH
jgi:ubiquinone/menaquinone biosynthesis C-methylase UbiE